MVIQKILAAYRQEIEKMAPVKPNDPAAFRKLYNFLLKCNGLKVDDNQNPLDTPDVICKIWAKLYSKEAWICKRRSQKEVLVKRKE